MERVVARLIRLEVSRSIASQALQGSRNVHPFRSGPRASIAQLLACRSCNTKPADQEEHIVEL